jgi:hypothetical protein
MRAELLSPRRAIVPWSIASRISPRPTVLLLCRGDAPQAVGALHGATQKINPEQTLGTPLGDRTEGGGTRE